MVTPQQPQRNWKKVALIAGGAVVAVLALLIVIGLVLGPSPEPDPATSAQATTTAAPVATTAAAPSATSIEAAATTSPPPARTTTSRAPAPTTSERPASPAPAPRAPRNQVTARDHCSDPKPISDDTLREAVESVDLPDGVALYSGLVNTDADSPNREGRSINVWVCSPGMTTDELILLATDLAAAVDASALGEVTTRMNVDNWTTSPDNKLHATELRIKPFEIYAFDRMTPEQSRTYWEVRSEAHN
jgi:pyruvate/2-oxoglutarate dehydrogenase complex dihydrolipoamide acyltransferase (E2) component